MNNYSDKNKFLYRGYTFEQQQKFIARREELRKELEKDFKDMFVITT